LSAVFRTGPLNTTYSKAFVVVQMSGFTTTTTMEKIHVTDWVLANNKDTETMYFD